MAFSAKIAHRERCLAKMQQEKRWVAEHGGSLAAYVERYGSVNDPEHYGDGGEAIYAADVAAMEKAEADALEAIRQARES